MANLGATFRRLTGTSRAGRSEVATATVWTTPYASRTADGVYVGHNGEVRMYRTVRLAPMRTSLRDQATKSGRGSGSGDQLEHQHPAEVARPYPHSAAHGTKGYL
jgi:hypothetical protein